MEFGQGDSTGGKTTDPVELHTGGRFAVGISVDGARPTYVLVNQRGQVVSQQVTAGVGVLAPRVVLERIAAEVVRLLDDHGVGSTAEWEQFALEPPLEEATGPPVIEHDHVCAALGEFWVG